MPSKGFRPPASRRNHRPNNSKPPRNSPSARATSAHELDRALDATIEASHTMPETFAAAGLPPRLVSVLAQGGMTTPFAIQARTLPDALAGRDVLGRAQTGSGKTLAFGLPLLAQVSALAAPAPGRPLALVLVPTRELAQQIDAVLGPLGKAVGVRTAAVYGGASMRQQITALRRGAGVVIATPGRLIDLIEQGECDLSEISVTVLDEADYMADLGFLPAVTGLLEQTPAGGQRMMFSATLDRGVDKLVTRFLNEPALHAVADAAAPVGSVEHRVFSVQPEHKVSVAAEVASRPGRSLFFVRTKHGADRLAKQFNRSGVEAAAIHGNLSQSQRTRTLARFAAGRPRVLVATDVAARGIHVDDVDLVVHFDLPGDHKDYLHRSGRTARAGANGTVLSLVHPDQDHAVKSLHRRARVDAETISAQPGHQAVVEVANSGEPIVVTDTTPPASTEPRKSTPAGAGRNRRRRGSSTGRGPGRVAR